MSKKSIEEIYEKLPKGTKTAGTIVIVTFAALICMVSLLSGCKDRQTYKEQQAAIKVTATPTPKPAPVQIIIINTNARAKGERWHFKTLKDYQKAGLISKDAKIISVEGVRDDD